MASMSQIRNESHEIYSVKLNKIGFSLITTNTISSTKKKTRSLMHIIIRNKKTRIIYIKNSC